MDENNQTVNISAFVILFYCLAVPFLLWTILFLLTLGITTNPPIEKLLLFTTAVVVMLGCTIAGYALSSRKKWAPTFVIIAPLVMLVALISNEAYWYVKVANSTRRFIEDDISFALQTFIVIIFILGLYT